MGRDVVVYKQAVRNQCVNCYYDSLTNTSTGKCKWTAVEAMENQAAWVSAGNTTTKYKYFVKGRCPICSGLGYIEILRKTTVKCIINWAPSDNDLLQTVAGITGATPVLLKTSPVYMDLFKNCDHVNIDGIDCILSTPPMLRGLGNESMLFVLAFTSKSVLEPKSTELIKEYYGKPGNI